MKPVLQIFAAMLIHESFQNEMEANPEAVLNAKGYTLTQAELQVVLRIVDSFKDGNLDDAADNVRAECPNWPCNDPSLAA
jgi:hypothetical protein